MDFTPDPFPISVPIIAPFWADSDTRCAGRSGNVFFRETTSNSIRAKVANEIQSSLFPPSAFYPSSLVIVTWDQIKYFDACYHSDIKVKSRNVRYKCQLLTVIHKKDK